MINDLSTYTPIPQVPLDKYLPKKRARSRDFHIVSYGHYRLVAFDMDSTLIQTEVIDELAYAAGVGEKVAAVTAAAMYGELDFKQSLIQRVALLTGLEAQTMHDIAVSLPLTEGVEYLLGTLPRLGYKTAIISSGFDYFARFLQQKLGFDHVYANTLEIRNGKLTGQIRGEIVDGPQKARLLKQIAAQEGFSLQQTVAVGDGANDLFMLDVAGLGVAFNAKPLVRERADRVIANTGLDALLDLLGINDHREQDRQFIWDLMLRAQGKNQGMRKYHA